MILFQFYFKGIHFGFFLSLSLSQKRNFIRVAYFLTIQQTSHLK